jgi:hypothetical protein
VNEAYFRVLIERAGAKFFGLKNNAVLFRENERSPVCSLYPFALKSVGDILLALKSEREKQRAAMWELEPVKVQ